MSEVIRFHVFYKGARNPMRADASALGSLSTRAFRYCEAIRTASSYGWYIFPALDFSLLWNSDDNGMSWRCDSSEGPNDWQFLSDGVQFPGQSDLFDEAVPEDIRGFSPPWLARMWEPGHVQIWSGLVARTLVGTSLLVRPVANLPRSGGYEVYEGIVETDSWFGPLFSNIRLTRSDQPVEFRTHWPIAQVQPIPKFAYADRTLDDVVVLPGLDKLNVTDWDDFRRTVVSTNLRPNRPYGEDAAIRRRSRNRT